VALGDLRLLLARIRVTPLQALVAVLGLAVLCRTFRLRQPNQAVIFDERYYVNAARVILGWHVNPGDPYADSTHGIDPNREHPPLGKLLIAGSMKLFGNDALGWRLPSLVAGVAAIVLVYLIVREAARDDWLATIAATAFAFDNLVIVHGRIATLDMPYVALLLLGVWLWLRGRPFLAGAACGLATLVKLPALYGAAALVLLALGAVAYERWRRRTWSRSHVRALVLLLVSFLGVWLLGLWALDVVFTPYDSPFAHLRYMWNYGFALSHGGGPVNSESNPWQWLANRVQIPYFKVDQNISSGGHVTQTRPLIDFEGAMNPVVIGVAPLAFAYSAWRAWRFRDTLSVWVVAWVAATYLSYYPLVLISHRTAYLYYFLPTLPAVAVAIAQLLRQSALPRVVTWGFLVGLAVTCYEYFPFQRLL
jgi:dolichyl-phosphate-mannose-protein mannosyltransferase